MITKNRRSQKKLLAEVFAFRIDESNKNESAKHTLKVHLEFNMFLYRLALCNSYLFRPHLKVLCIPDAFFLNRVEQGAQSKKNPWRMGWTVAISFDFCFSFFDHMHSVLLMLLITFRWNISGASSTSRAK